MINISNYFKGFYFLDKSNLLNTPDELFFLEFNKLTLEIEELLKKEQYDKQTCYNDWQQMFKLIYGKEYLKIHLYTIYAQLYYIAHIFILHFILAGQEKLKMNQSNFVEVKNIQRCLLNEYSTDISFLNPYFLPIIELLKRKNISILDNIKQNTLNCINEAKVKSEFFFDYLFQKVVKPLFRHASGEFYTPPFLVKKMIKESYEFGDKVLDPSCGTGNFLIETVKLILSTKKPETDKIKALNNIYGFDINPMSIFITIINIILLSGKKINKLNSHFLIIDSLFYNNDLNAYKFNLVIGNPPWYTFRDIDSIIYQNKVKKLAEDLKIKPSPKNVLNIEISSLFFYKAKKAYMLPEAKIFFVITKGVITGSHASRFRSFRGFKDLRVWTFDTKIEKVFNIDFICLYAHKSNDSNFVPPNYQIPSICFGLDPLREQLDYFEEVNLKEIKQDTLTPYSIVRKGDKTYVQKLITKSNYSDLIPVEYSIYKKLFHKGADLNPRSLIFIKFQSKNENLAIVDPDDRIFKRAKSPWDKKVFYESIIEKEYIFKVVKSTELIKFHIFDFYHVFLPISADKREFVYSNLQRYSKNFYDKINEYYINHKKATTKNKSLMDNLNRWSKLINDRQFSQIKVVYNNSGSILSAAVIQGDFLVTGDLSFLATNDLEEAYYLSAILNSNLLNQQIKIKKSSRHIFKIPFEIPIQKFNEHNESHHNLALLGMEGEKVAKSLIKELSKKDSDLLSRYMLQNLLTEKLKPILTKIDDFLKPQFFNSK